MRFSKPKTHEYQDIYEISILSFRPTLLDESHVVRDMFGYVDYEKKIKMFGVFVLDSKSSRKNLILSLAPCSASSIACGEIS